MAAWTQHLQALRLRTRVSALPRRICLSELPTCLHRDIQHPACLSSCVSPSRVHTSTRIINSFPISYAFQPCLRGRLTLGRLPLPRKPRVYGEQVFYLFYRYSCQHNHFPSVHRALRLDFCQMGTLPYHFPREIQSFGIILSPVTFSAQNYYTSELLRFL